MNRPQLNKNLDPEIFLSYYYLKEELIEFCKQQGIAYSGNKQELTDAICYFLKTGKKPNTINAYSKKPKSRMSIITIESIIEENFVCTEKHRAFFKSIIGDDFKFYVEFQKYLKESAGQTYLQAVGEWYKIKDNKRANKGKNKIDKQFEYNTYIRDFFKDNKNLSLKNAIVCWKFKKSLPGHNRYEKEDLEVIGVNPN